MRRALSFVLLAATLGLGNCLLVTDHGDDWPCSGQDDCEAGQRCMQYGGKLFCRPEPQCDAIKPCPGGQICENNFCITPQCNGTNASECGNYACNLATHRCPDSCNGSSQCAPGKVCSSTSFQCVPAECSGAGQCGGFKCSGGLCLKSCNSYDGCEAGFGCFAATCKECVFVDGKCTDGSGGTGGSGGAAGKGGSSGTGGSGGKSGSGGSGGSSGKGGTSGSGGAGTGCAHDPCASGTKLDPTCSSCAKEVCASDSYCCDTQWDATCVSEASSTPSCGCGTSVKPTCDPIKQTGCTSSGAPKCTVIEKGSQTSNYVTWCMGLDGSLGANETCNSGELGNDECAPRLICTSYGVADYDSFEWQNGKQCKAFCQKSADCGGGEECVSLSSDGFGVCIETCDPFGTCSTGNPTTKGVCSRVYWKNEIGQLSFGCRREGYAAQDEGCNDDFDCKGGLVCVFDKTPPPNYLGACSAICDATHFCPASKTCALPGASYCPAGQRCVCL